MNIVETVTHQSDAPPRATTFIIHRDGSTNVLQASEHDTLETILERAGLELDGDSNIFLGEFTGALGEPEEIEDGADDHAPIDPHHLPSHHGHGGGVVHIHCHRCRLVCTGVSYNGQDKHHRFSPAATIETVRRWATKKFKIPAVDAEKLFLWLSGAEQPLDGTKHVGDLTHAPGCKVELLMLPDPRVNG